MIRGDEVIAPIGLTPHTSVLERQRLALGTLLYVAGIAILYALPAFLALIGGRLKLNADQLGTLAAAETLGIGITSLAGPFWVSRIDRRTTVLLGAITCIIGDLSTAYSHNYQIIALLRFLVGLFGEGVLITVCYAVLHAARNVDRAFAVALTVATAFGSATIAAAGTLDRALPAIGPLVPLILVAAAILPFIRWLPSLGHLDLPTRAKSPSPKLNVAAILALSAQTLWFAAPGGFWAFVEQVATDRAFLAVVPKLQFRSVLSPACGEPSWRS